MRFYKEVWGIIWEFNGIGEYISFMVGRLLGVIIFFGGMYLLVKCSGSDASTLPEHDYEPYPASFYQYE
jgi:NADH:ubiquinone oxidoreductase subunit H